jgi:hypothetical protein
MRKSTAGGPGATQERRAGCAEVAVCSVNASEKESCCNPSPASARTRRCRLSLVIVVLSYWVAEVGVKVGGVTRAVN